MSGVLAGGCAQTEEAHIPPDALLTGEEFVKIPKPDDDDGGIGLIRQAATGSGSVINPKKGEDFYLAIKKSDLDKRWFLTAYLNQFHPDNVSAGAARALGTRVVSFKVQNGKLFVFDASDQFHASDVFDPQVLVEAFPVITGYAPFEALTNSDKYTLIDPSAGLNRFQVAGDVFADPYLTRQSAGVPFNIGISFMQEFHKVKDGVSFQQVFSGNGIWDDGVNPPFNYLASGTLTIGLRRYFEGEGFVKTPYADDEYFFRSDRRYLPGTGFVTSNPVKWNIKPGMTPIKFYIGRGAVRAQADYPDIKILDALKQGIEGWNAVFGFQAFKAEIEPESGLNYGDPDVNMVIVDYPGVYAGYAFSNWRTNPNTGEILSSTIFFDAVWFDAAAAQREEASAPPSDPNLLPKPEKKPQIMGITWGGMNREQSDPACVVWAPKYRHADPRHLTGTSPDAAAAATNPEKYLTHVLLHEMGHSLGLRHNFKGSLTNSSVMDYLDDYDSIGRDTPGAYDIQAVKYLYNLTNDYPTAPFCTDNSVTSDPDCGVFDWGADPMHEMWGDYYTYFAELYVFTFGFPAWIMDFIGVTDGLLAYSRNGWTEEQAVEALNIALYKGKAPVDAAAAADDPYFGPAADSLSIYVLQRLWLDPVEWRGYITNDPYYTGVYELSLDQLRQIVKNDDKVRSFEARRVSVDILKKFQTLEAYQGLVEAKGLLQAQIAAGAFAGGDLLQANDLMARIDRAISPYFVN